MELSGVLLLVLGTFLTETAVLERFQGGPASAPVLIDHLA
jgi:hypothetical protein